MTAHICAAKLMGRSKTRFLVQIETEYSLIVFHENDIVPDRFFRKRSPRG